MVGRSRGYYTFLLFSGSITIGTHTVAIALFVGRGSDNILLLWLFDGGKGGLKSVIVLASLLC